MLVREETVEQALVVTPRARAAQRRNRETLFRTFANPSSKGGQPSRSGPRHILSKVCHNRVPQERQPFGRRPLVWKAKRLCAGWAEQKVIREIMLFLHSHGVGTSRAVRIYKTYGADAVRVVSDNPYRLARDIRSIGFRTADQIAQHLGIERTAMIRVRAGISYALAEAMDEGHCGLPEAELLQDTGALLEVEASLVLQALADELQAGEVIADTLDGRPCVFLAGLYRAEREIAERLLTAARGSLPWGTIDTDKAVPWVEAKTGMCLAPSQREALALAVRSKALVITGGPGVGKTTLVNSILRVLAAKRVEVALCAPTGRAAKRLSESTGMEAKTIHRLLEADPKQGGFKRGETHPLGSTCSSWTSARWWTCPSCARCSGRCPHTQPCCWWATWTSCPRWGRAKF